MNTFAAEAALFGDALACLETLPAAFLPGALDPAAVEAACVRAEACLQAIAVIEDSRAEDPEEHGPHALALRRIEARLELLTHLVAGLGRHAAPDPAQPLRWSALGACLPLPAGAGAGEGDTGLFRAQAAPWLAEPLLLPARVLAVAAGPDGLPQAWLHFTPLTPGLSAALERHLFRRHRREVAERRRHA